MTKEVKLRLLDEVSCILVGLHGDHITKLYEQFGIFVPGYFFQPLFKLGRWDGKTRFFQKTGKTFIYLLDRILPKLKQWGYNVIIEDLREAVVVTPQPIDRELFSHINHIDTGEATYLRDHQVEAVNALIDAGHGIVIAATSAGKAQPMTSKILTSTGWKLMGDMKVGDSVITPRGNTTIVTGVFPQGTKDIFEIEFADGAKTRACGEHLWTAYVPTRLHTAKTSVSVISTHDMIDFLKRKQSGKYTPGNISIPLIIPHSGTDATLPVDPYVLGALLGDGSLASTIVFSNKDSYIIDRVSSFAAQHNMKMVYVEGSSCDYRLSKIDKQTTYPPIKSYLNTHLEALGLFKTKSNSKFIPTIYKNTSLHQRWELLRGLFDTDGTVDKRGNVSFTTTSSQLAADVQEMVWAVGGMCRVTSRYPTFSYKGVKKTGQLAYTCFVRHPSPSHFFFTPTKKNMCKISRDTRGLRRIVKSITPVSAEPAQCIMVQDNDHLYITDDYIVTHNTIMCAALCTAYGQHDIKTITIVPNQDLIRQTKQDYTTYGLDVGEYSGTLKDLDHQHAVSTWQALKNNPKIIQLFQMVIVDECHQVRGKVLTEILTDHASKMPYRFGVTGTLPKEPADQLSVTVAIGGVKYTVNAAHLIDKGILSNLHISVFQLEENLEAEYKKFCAEECITHKPPTYIQFKDSYLPDFTAEKDYLQKNKTRLEWIAEMIETKRDEKKGNVLCLVDTIAAGRKLAACIEGAIFVNGQDVKQKDRKDIYDLFKQHDDLVVIATVHIAGTGLSINRIFNLFLVDIGKSFVRVIQAIGRGLRMASDKNFVNVYDVCSDLKYSKRHVTERLHYYKEAAYPHKKHKIKYTA